MHETTPQPSPVEQELIVPTNESLETPEVLTPTAESVETPALEQELASIETATGLTDSYEAKVVQFAALPEEEKTFVTDEIEHSPEGKGIVATMKEKFAQLVHAQGHLHDKLVQEHNYHPKLVQTVGKVGSILGGVLGTIAGHGFLGAGTSVAGAKAGGYGALKAMEHIGNRIPSMREKMLNKASPEQQEKLATVETMHTQTLENYEANLSTLSALQERVQHLSPEQQQQVAQLLERNIKAQTGTEILAESHKKHKTLFEKFEHKMPMLATATEYTTHVLIGPSLHAVGISMDLLHTIELWAAGGGAETITKKLVNSVKHLGDIFQKFKPKTPEALPETTAEDFLPKLKDKSIAA